MKNKIFAGLLLSLMAGMMFAGTTSYAKPTSDKIAIGVYADEVNLSGMTKEEAAEAIDAYILEKSEEKITITAGNEELEVSRGDLGVAWGNPDVVEEAYGLGKSGNLIKRYKAIKDLEFENKVFDLEYTADLEMIKTVVTEQCTKLNREATNMGLEKTASGFQVIEGKQGIVVDEAAAPEVVLTYIEDEFDGTQARIAIPTKISEPLGSKEELSKVKDLLGTFKTSFKSSNSNRSKNVKTGAGHIDGTVLYPGEEFSAYAYVSPFSVENGYEMAGSYLNGKTVDSLGGGICQVSTTLYNAVLKSELEVTERYNHSMIVNYVDPSADAAIAESAGKDFKFVNTTDAPVYIEGIIKNKNITFNIYGQETRSADRKVTYVSEVLEVINPTVDAITADQGQPIGYVVVNQSAHIGYKAKLWKVVTENGKEVERTQVNYSSYKMTPRYATVGVATADPNALNEMLAAIGTGSLDHVKNVIALLQAQAAQPAQ